MKTFTLAVALLTSGLIGGFAGAQTSPAPSSPPSTPATSPTTSPAPASSPAAPAAAPAPAAPAAPAPKLAPATDPNAVVAKIGEEKITLGEFEDAFRIAIARMVNAQGMPFESTMLSDFAEVRPSFLKQMVRDRVIARLAAGAHQADNAAVEAQFKKARDNFKTEDEFNKALITIGFKNAAEYRSYLERQSLVSAYQKALLSKFTFADKVVQGYYNLHRNNFVSEAQACVKHILVKEEAEARAIEKELSGGADFAKIATEKSLDPGSAQEGGDLGCIAPGDTVPTFDKASFSGAINAVQVVQSQYGWHILVVTKRTEEGLQPLASVSDKIRDHLAREAAQKYLDAQVAKVKVESFPELVTTVESK